MAQLEYTLSCHPSDRTNALLTGDVEPDGIDLTVVPQAADRASRALLEFGDVDVAEVSIADFLATATDGEGPFVAIPAFTGRAFVHGTIYVHGDTPIGDPVDLAGCRIGLSPRAASVGLWVRGILGDRHGLDHRDLEWVEPPTSDGTASLLADGDLHVSRGSASLETLLTDGELDALVSPVPPAGFPDEAIKRLFPATREVEETYTRETGVFPIHRVIAMRRDRYETNPWVAQELFKAFERAKGRAEAALDAGLDFPCMVPWLPLELEATREVLGEAFWPYGIEPNRETLEALLRYADEQGLTAGRLAMDDVFATETFAGFAV